MKDSTRAAQIQHADRPKPLCVEELQKVRGGISYSPKKNYSAVGGDDFAQGEVTTLTFTETTPNSVYL